MTRPEADALKTYIDFMAAQTEDHERELERKAYEEAEALKKAEEEKAARKIVDHQAPNFSIECYYDPVSCCMRAEVKAWTPLTEKEKASVEKFIKGREVRTPYPLGGIINQTENHAADAAYMAWGKWIEEGGPIRPQDFDEIIQRRARIWRSSTGFNFKNIPEPLTREGAKLFRECVENNFNREPILSEASNDGVNWTPAPKSHLSIKQLWGVYKVNNNLIDPVDGGHAVEFAKLIRNMTVEEVKGKASAHIEIIDDGGGKEARAVIDYKSINENFIPGEL